MPNKLYAESCDQNCQPIAAQLDRFAPQCKSVLEIGSGTGQHAVYFARKYPQLMWQTSDLPAYHASIQAWIDESAVQNVLPPITLEACGVWPQQSFDLLFSANTLHIMSEADAECLLQHAPGCMKKGAWLVFYGPFNYNGTYSSASNKHFDGWLKQRDPASGIKHFEWLSELASQSGLHFIDDVTMPANNRILVFQRV